MQHVFISKDGVYTLINERTIVHKLASTNFSLCGEEKKRVLNSKHKDLHIIYQLMYIILLYGNWKLVKGLAALFDCYIDVFIYLRILHDPPAGSKGKFS